MNAVTTAAPAPAPTRPSLPATLALCRRMVQGYARFYATPQIPARDLEAIGVTACWRAWLAWDATGGASLLNFARHRVMGAMRDERRFWYGRGRADVRGVPQYEHKFRMSARSLDAARAIAAPTPAPDHAIALDQWLARIPSRSRTVIEQTLAGYTLDEIGATLGVCGPRVCQMRRQAFATLRACA